MNKSVRATSAIDGKESPDVERLLLEAEEAVAEREGLPAPQGPIIGAPRPVDRHDTVAILDFGSQYTQLRARRVRELGVYCEILPHAASQAEVARLHPKAYILSGGPASVYEPGAPSLPPYVLRSGLPMLG